MKNYQTLYDALTFELAKRDPYIFLTEFCKTVDERDGRIKPFPSMGNKKVCVACKKDFPLSEVEKETLEFGKCPSCGRELQVEWAYIKQLVRLWKDNTHFIIPKTRQMLISWLCVGLHLWLTVFHPNCFAIFQSETEEKAKELVKRLKDIWNNLPEFIRELYPLEEVPSLTQFRWKHGSRIRSVPQGVTQITGLTPSAVFCDEMGIQDQAEETYTQTVPALAGGGRLTIVGTPNGQNFFYRLIMDKKEGDV